MFLMGCRLSGKANDHHLGIGVPARTEVIDAIQSALTSAVYVSLVLACGVTALALQSALA